MGEYSVDSRQQPLWPYGNRAALIAAPLCWLAFAVMTLATRRFLEWPDAETGKVVLLLATAVVAL